MAVHPDVHPGLEHPTALAMPAKDELLAPAGTATSLDVQSQLLVVDGTIGCDSRAEVDVKPPPLATRAWIANCE